MEFNWLWWQNVMIYIKNNGYFLCYYLILSYRPVLPSVFDVAILIWHLYLKTQFSLSKKKSLPIADLNISELTWSRSLSWCPIMTEAWWDTSVSNAEERPLSCGPCCRTAWRSRPQQCEALLLCVSLARCEGTRGLTARSRLHCFVFCCGCPHPHGSTASGCFSLALWLKA